MRTRGVQSYRAELHRTTTRVRVTPLANRAPDRANNHPGATVKVSIGSGSTEDVAHGASSGGLALTARENTVYVTVTAEDGAPTVTYEMSVDLCADPTTQSTLFAQCTTLGMVKDTLEGTGIDVLNWDVNDFVGDWDGIREYDADGITELDLSARGLEGEISSRLGEINTLEQLYAHDNDLAGTIPPELADLALLTDLRLENNELTGQIPADLGEMAALTTLRLDNNRLTGQIPVSLGDLVDQDRAVKMDTLDLRYNYLTGCVTPVLEGFLINPQYDGKLNARTEAAEVDLKACGVVLRTDHPTVDEHYDNAIVEVTAELFYNPVTPPQGGYGDHHHGDGRHRHGLELGDVQRRRLLGSHRG